ncbi:zinc finger protein 414 isoform X1 [Dryobates pubescens]|uniref:zinc finger protein 414 isoform X1 n=1 Tax=Dryobates pubescens TaxID=118200 RepID=UPI0023B8EB76|nr:zinc finger protein 414 isoform X1 [Dryobates pubescens]
MRIRAAPAPAPPRPRIARSRHQQQHLPHPVPTTGQAMKTEKEEAVPSFSMGGKYAGEGAGSREAALPGGPVTGSGGTPAQDLRPLKRRAVPGKHYQCSSYGCKLAFSSMQELMDHLKVHYRPTQSLEGKTFQCPTLGCTETFPSMQDLMAHMKVHYKPNRYFKCENCLLRFRTHRSLFKHLHVCSDSASSPAPPPRPDRPLLPSAASTTTTPPEKEPSAKPAEGLPKLPSVLRPPERDAALPGADAAPGLPTSLPELPGSLEALPLVSHPFPLLEPNLFGPSSLTRFSGPPPPPPPSGPGPFLPYVPPAAYSLPPPAAQHRPRPFAPGHGVSNAVWKKSQGVSVSPLLPCFGSGVTPGHSSNSRIVWEHTRGRYTCMQCPYSTASRQDMTLHIEDHRKNPSQPGRLEAEMDFGVGLTSFHTKLTPEMENSLYSQL